MRSSIYWILTIILIINHGIVIAKDLPWDSEGKLHVLGGHSDKSYAEIYPFVEQYYIDRFGAYPGLVVWEEGDWHPITKWGVSFKKYYKEQKHVLPDTLTWGDVRPYVWWKLTSVKTGTVSYQVLTAGEDTTGIVDYFNAYAWHYAFEQKIEDLPIPNDGSAWKIELQVWESPPPDGQLVASLEAPPCICIRTYRTTAIDTFWFSRSYFVPSQATTLLRSSKELNLSLLHSFPYSKELLGNLMRIYGEEKHCDSLRWAARQFVESAWQNKDPFKKGEPWVSGGAVEKPPSTLESVHAYLLKVCGDTTLWEE